MKPVNPPVCVDRTAVGSTEHSIPAAEIIGRATVNEHLPTHEMSWTANTLLLVIARSTDYLLKTVFYYRLIYGRMDASDVHLERALNEYNSTVSMLEAKGDSPELVEAYVNRGCVLYMLGYFTSAMEDLESASEMMDDLENSGTEIDAGTYVKAHATMGAILFEQNSEISEEYSYAISRLPKLRTDSRHFDRAGLIRMCIESAENLIDSEYPEDAERFVRKGIDILGNSADRWSGNRLMELHTLLGECLLAEGDLRNAMDCYSEAIEQGTMLVDNNMIEDMEELVVPIISRSQCESNLGLDDLYLKDLQLAIDLLEEMAKINKLDDTEVLVHMHQDAASVLMSQGRIEEAEKHLLRAVSMGVSGAKDYLSNQTNSQL